MERQLVLIRHAESLPDHARPAAEWQLSEVGRAQAEALADVPFWASVRALYSSDEPKALGTASPAARRHGLQVRVRHDLHEVERPPGRLDDFDAAVGSYLTGAGTPPGWEPLEAAEARIRAAVEEILADSPAGHLALVSHGTVLALYACATLGIADRHAFWKGIPFAGRARLDPNARRLLSAFSR